MSSRRDIVLVGGGHAHVQTLRAFAEEPPENARLTVVVDVPVAVYSGMVPGFVAGQYESSELEIDVRPLAKWAGAEVVLSAAVAIDAANRRIEVADGRSVPYDFAAVDVGSTVAGLELPGIREHAFPTRPIGRFVQRVDEIVARAKEVGGRPLEVMIVGGGAGGVELAFCLGQRLENAGHPAAITLVQNRARILPGYPESLVRRAEREAKARGVEILCGREVAAAETGAVVMDDGERLACDALVWVTGAVSHPLFRDSGLPTDERGFLRIRSTLQSEHHDELLASGDCATLIEHPRTPKAGVYAVRQGPYVTANLRALLAGRPLEEYTPQGDFLTLLNLGDGRALGAKWGVSFGGRWVMWLKDRIDRAFVEKYQLESQPVSG